MSAGDRPTATHSRQRRRGDDGSPVVRTYYDRPVIKEPVWTWEIPWYFWTGGIAGGSAVLTGMATLAGRDELARVARRVGTAALLPSPLLLVNDLGRPERFHHMLRVFRPTSPMSVGSWTLLAFSGAQGGAWVLAELGWSRRVRVLADLAAGALGTVIATYTAVLFTDTAVPVWHEARNELPFVFAAGAAASAGAAVALAGGAEADTARRLAVGGAVAELATDTVMRRRLGDLAEPYERDDAHRYATAARWLTTAGAVAGALGGRRPWVRRVGAVLTLAGALAQRWAVYRAGFVSARDPRYTVRPQRDRVDRNDGAFGNLRG